MFDKTKAKVNAKVVEPINRAVALAAGAFIIALMALSVALASLGRKQAHAV